MVALALTLVALGCGIWFALKPGIVEVEHYPDQAMSDEWRSNLRRDYGEDEDCEARSRTKTAAREDESAG